MPYTHSEISLEVAALRDRGAEAASEFFERDREKLKRFVMHRMDGRLLGRLDWEDVLQEGFLVVQNRYQDYVASPSVPFYIWMRSITGQVLIDLHRKHFNVQQRSVSREVSLHQQLPFQSTAESLGNLLAGSGTSPSGVVIRAEQAHELRRVLAGMSELDREVLVLRHLEQMTNSEVASVLGIDKSTATKRYIRALTRLAKMMES